MIKVALAEDQRLIREGLRMLIESDQSLRVVGEAEDGYACVKMVERVRPDVVIIDIVMPRFNGIDAAQVISERFPAVRTIMLSMYQDGEYIYRALRSGATGYILKDSAGSDVVRAVHAVYGNRRYLSPSITESIISSYLQQNGLKEKSPLESLSAREREVLQLVAEGKTSVQVAEELFLSPKTVETYRSRIMSKLHLRSTADLVRFALRHGLEDALPGQTLGSTRPG